MHVIRQTEGLQSFPLPSSVFCLHGSLQKLYRYRVISVLLRFLIFCIPFDNFSFWSLQVVPCTAFQTHPLVVLTMALVPGLIFYSTVPYYFLFPGAYLVKNQAKCFEET